MSPRASIVMVAWGKRAMTAMTLESLQRALGPKLGAEFELVLVDNNSPDDTLELFDAWEDRATVVRLPENRQFAGGCNAGAQAASGEVLLFLNNDMEFLPGALEALVEQALAPDVGIVGARLLYPDGAIQHAGVVWRAFRGIGPTPVHLFHFAPGELPHARAVYDLDAVTGACIVMRRELFEEIGAFDEEFVNGLEDIDLCVRVRLEGMRVLYRGDIALVHHESVTRGRDLTIAQHNLRRFHAKWRDMFDDDSELLAQLFDGIFTEGEGLAFFAEYVEGAPLAVEGYLSGLGSDSAEGRALVLALEEAGLAPAVRDWRPAWVEARLAADEVVVLNAGSERARSPLGLSVHVVPGPWAPVPGGRSAIARMAEPPSRTEPITAARIWAADPRTAEALADRGVPAERIAYVPPVIAGIEPGQGGEGVLVLLPVDEPERARAMLAATAGLDAPVRALPTVRTQALEQLVATAAPHVELLGPMSSEREFGVLAGRHDAVVAGDPDDRFDRRALVAAAAGAAPIVLRPGPCSAVLGEDGVLSAIDELAAALRAALARPARAERAAAVAARCSPAVLAPQLRALVADTVPRLGDDELAALAGGTSRVGG